ncbi:unnamed protein product, partial [Cyprideis torosa]
LPSFPQILLIGSLVDCFEMGKRSVLFVCLANTCRSPMAEAIFAELSDPERWDCDSAGTSSMRVGSPPDPRSMAVMTKYGLKKTSHVARQVRTSDFTKFDYILCMDEGNLAKVMSMRPPNVRCHIGLLAAFDPLGKKEVSNPFKDRSGVLYEQCYAQRGASRPSYNNRMIAYSKHPNVSLLPNAKVSLSV